MNMLQRLLALMLAFGLLAGCTGPIFATPTPIPPVFETRAPVSPVPVTVIPKDDRPNIILILVDDLDSKLGTIDYMPHLQELMVKRGLTIKDFFVTDTTCCPSRTTILRGEYTHNHKIYTSKPVDGFEEFYELDYDSSTLATWLQAAGYRTIFLGKYLNGYPIRFDRTYVPQGWDEWYSPARGKPYYGFDYTLNHNGNLIPFGANPEEYLLDVLTAEAMTFLRDPAQEDQPVFMFMSPFQPHEPALPAPRHANMYLDLQAPRTESFNEADVSDKPDHIKYDPLLTEEQIVDLDQFYLNRVQSMQSVDEMIAQLFDVLNETGRLENTYVIFTSDNGYHLGQHRMKAGKSSAYDEDINVPFVVFGPGIPPNEVLEDVLAGNVDIGPTIADLAGVVPSTIIDGRSLVPLIQVDDAGLQDWRNAYLIEYYLESTEASTMHLMGYEDRSGILEPYEWENYDFSPSSLAYYGIRTKDYLYVKYTDGFVEFYDLRSDPYEMENLAATANPDLLLKLSVWLDELFTCRGDSCRMIEAKDLP